jgi:hypothetical protein
MRRRFPVKVKGPPLKAAVYKAMVLSTKPIFFSSKNEAAQFPYQLRNGNTSFPVILNFPFMVI